MSLVYYAHLGDMTISHPHLLQTRPKQIYSFLTFTFGTKSDITLMCVKNWLLNSMWVGDMSHYNSMTQFMLNVKT